MVARVELLHRHLPPAMRTTDEAAPPCPLEKNCRLRVVNCNAMLVECELSDPEVCHKAFSFGDVYFCGALLKPATEQNCGAPSAPFRSFRSLFAGFSNANGVVGQP